MTIVADLASYDPGDDITITIAAHSETPNACTINGVAATIQPGASSSLAVVTAPLKSEFVAGGAHELTRWGIDLTLTLSFPTEADDSDTIQIEATDGDFYQATSGTTELDSSHEAGTSVGDDVYWETIYGAGTVDADGVWQVTSVPLQVQRRWFNVSVGMWSAIDPINFFTPTTASQNLLQAALSPSTTEQLVECITIDHPDLSDPLLLVNDRQDLTRTAGTFVAFPFTGQLHARSESQNIEATITADNVDQRIIEALRGLERGTTVTWELVLRDTPNVVEKGPMEFTVFEFGANLEVIELRMGYELDYLAEAFPKDYFAPWNQTAA